LTKEHIVKKNDTPGQIKKQGEKDFVDQARERKRELHVRMQIDGTPKQVKGQGGGSGVF